MSAISIKPRKLKTALRADFIVIATMHTIQELASTTLSQLLYHLGLQNPEEICGANLFWVLLYHH